MKTINRFLLILCLFLFFVNTSQGQDNLQNIFHPAFNNPAYNAFNDCYSANLVYRNQWGNKVEGSPETYGLNLFFPTESKLGVGLLALNEKYGVSNRFTLFGLLSHYVKLTEKSFLGFGYGVGIDHNSYDISKIYDYNPDIIVSDDELDNDVNAKISAGIFYNMPNFYSGISFNTTLNSEYSKYKVARGLDWIAAYYWDVNDDLILKPDVAIKYYKIRESIYVNSTSSNDWIDPIFNVGVNALLFNRVWLGIHQRFDYAQTYSVSFFVNRSLKIGYTFERGIGNGVNQFDSHMFGLSWNYRKNKIKQKHHNTGEKFSNEKEKFITDVRDQMYW